jgi:hypothetical protein
MSVQIQLDDNKSSYTNLDFINGRIVLSLDHDESISAVVVKLGESKSAIERAQGTGRYPRSTLVTKMINGLGFNGKGWQQRSTIFYMKSVKCFQTKIRLQEVERRQILFIP